MELVVCRSLWGVEGAWEEVFPRLRAEGFGGIETRVPADPAERARLRRALDASGMRRIAEISAKGYVVPDPSATPADHLAELAAKVGPALELEPLFINGYHGRDAWAFDDQCRFVEGFLDLERRSGIAMTMELHRGRSLYNPWITRDLLRRFPTLKLTCDFSHWCVVAERLLTHEADIIALCAEHAWHIHGRVGYDQGPQVPDPRAPEYAEALAAHESWWDAIWRSQERRGMPVATWTPEYGIEGYLHHLPWTDVPVADLWSICRWAGQRAAARYAAGNWRWTA
jgi:hypothetical protein